MYERNLTWRELSMKMSAGRRAKREQTVYMSGIGGEGRGRGVLNLWHTSVRL
jgi:hypothetical protein